MSKRVPAYLRIAPDGGLMVEPFAWEESDESREQIERMERLREAIQGKRRGKMSAGSDRPERYCTGDSVTTLEQLLRDSWDAGFEECSECAGKADIPLDSLFENYMEDFCERLDAVVEPEEPKTSQADAETRLVALQLAVTASGNLKHCQDDEHLLDMADRFLWFLSDGDD